MAAWLKTFRAGDEMSPRTSPSDRPAIGGSWMFYEPLSLNEDGSPKRSKRGEPFGRPGWEVGDWIAGYWSGSYEVGEVWEVLDAPQPSERADWSWQTRVALLADGPSVPIADLSISPRSLARRVRLRLTAEQTALLERGFQLQGHP
jgi:hypothetical protein